MIPSTPSVIQYTEGALPLTAPDEADVTNCLQRLRSADLETRCTSLIALKQGPLPDERIAVVVESMLEDRSACLLQLPYKFGEVRWLAAHALAALRRALGKPELVTLSGVAAPIDLADLSALATKQGVVPPKGLSLLESSFFKFDELSRRNALPRCDVALNQADAGAPSYRPL